MGSLGGAGLMQSLCHTCSRGFLQKPGLLLSLISVPPCLLVYRALAFLSAVKQHPRFPPSEPASVVHDLPFPATSWVHSACSPPSLW